jgi:hypothetical protein
MSAEELRKKLTRALNEQFPNAKIIEVHEMSFTYEIEENNKISKFIVKYIILPPNCDVKIDWKNTSFTS